MKLKSKIALGAGSILLAALLLSACLLLTIYWQSTCRILTEQALTEQQVLSRHFGIEMDAMTNGQTPEEVRDSAAIYIFDSLTASQLHGTYCSLAYEGTTLRGDSLLDGKVRYLYQEENGGLFSLDGRYYCRAADSSWRAEGYKITLFRDVTDTIQTLIGATALCAGGCLLVLTLAVLSMMLYLKKALRPLDTLREGAEAVAAGQYQKRLALPPEPELKAVSEAFNQMAQAVETHLRKVEATAEERQLLLRALAHEMRTPVTAISGCGEALERPDLGKEQREAAARIMASESRRLERLSTKLTELITLDFADITMEEIPARELGQSLREILGSKEIPCSVTAAGTLRGDQDLLLVFLTNLVDNGRKANAASLQISLSPEALTVRDNGCGIAPEDLERVTQPFYQGDKSRSRGGFGFGLALCRRIAELHGGTLHIESTLGEGTAISLVFEKKLPEGS